MTSKEWKTYKLSDFIDFKNGKKRPINNGQIPVFGGNGILSYTDEYNYENCIIIGRVGIYCGNVFYSLEKCWVSDNAIMAKNKHNTNIKFIYYLLKFLKLNARSIGTGQPLLTQEILNNIEILLPPLETQEKIARVLSSLDDKIELNNKINQNLEQQAQAIFKSWFVDFEPFGGKMPDDWRIGALGEYVEIKRGGSPRPIQNYITDKGYKWLKISDVTSLQTPFIYDIKEAIKESGLNKTVLLKAGTLVLSNSATPGIPKILSVDSCIHDGWLYFPESKFPNEYLYLLFKSIRKNLVSLGNGSVFTNLKTDILRNYQTVLPSESVLKNFVSIVKPIFSNIQNNTLENINLTQLRDTLLPKLMNGEIDVDKVEV